VEASVLVPTYKRPGILGRCLDHLAGQREAPAFEVVVAIDGEDDYGEAELERRARDAPYSLKVIHGPHRGHSAALNDALRAAGGELAIVIGDDILAGPGFVAAHCARHRALDDRRTAVQGRVGWHPELLPDAFLDWESRKGILFAFNHMEEHTYVPTRFFFTCNVSMRTDWLRELGGFDESLDWWIDTVFAYEGSKRGLRVYYDPDAWAWHLDRWRLERFARRRYLKGGIAVKLLERDPGFADFVIVPRPGPWRTLRWAASRAVRPVVERVGPRALRDWCWIHEANYRFVQGMADARRGRARAMGEVSGPLATGSPAGPKRRAGA
jgi:glycosyltransferase involved in cell wall biosynthesis